MKYLLLAWSEGNCAAKAGQSNRSCPYQFGVMRKAWLKGFGAGGVTETGTRKYAYKSNCGRRLAA